MKSGLLLVVSSARVRATEDSVPENLFALDVGMTY